MANYWIRACGPPLFVVTSYVKATAAPCTPLSNREDIVRCALAQSPEVASARAELRANAGRRIAAGILLPTNPAVSAYVAGRRPPAAPNTPWAVNWGVTLSQEIEIAGQRGTRVAVVASEASAQARRVAIAEQEVAAVALRLVYVIAAARTTATLAREIASTSQTLSQAVEARAQEALLSRLDADLLQSDTTRALIASTEAERRVASAEIALATLLAVDATMLRATSFDLDAPAMTLPAPDALVELAWSRRAELDAAKLEREVLANTVRVLRRSRAPNPTVSLYVQNDGFDELVVGGGLSLPIPLPAPLGRTKTGEIAETEARIESADASIEAVRRRVRVEVLDAVLGEEARTRALAAYPAPVVARAKDHLAALTDALTQRRMTPREALVARRALIELLQGEVEARLAVALARVELARAIGALTTGGAR